MCIYVSCLGSRLGVPAISPSLPDVNKKISWSKKGRHFDWPLRVLKIEILQISKKWQNPKDFRILVLFSDLKNSTFKYPYRPCKVPPLFPLIYPHRTAQKRTEKQKKSKDFAWPLEVLISKILKI
jgi:hypothetical protein